MERETRIELATNSLEGCDSTIELLPLFLSAIYVLPWRARMRSSVRMRIRLPGRRSRCRNEDRNEACELLSWLAVYYPHNTPLRRATCEDSLNWTENSEAYAIVLPCADESRSCLILLCACWSL